MRFRSIKLLLICSETYFALPLFFPRLGTHAFHSVLSVKRTTYAQAGVLGALYRDLTRPRYRGTKRRLGRLAAASLQRMRAQPIPRLGTPVDVARAILFLADRETGFITGQNIYVGGGAELLHSGTL